MNQRNSFAFLIKGFEKEKLSEMEIKNLSLLYLISSIWNYRTGIIKIRGDQEIQ